MAYLKNVSLSGRCREKSCEASIAQSFQIADRLSWQRYVSYCWFDTIIVYYCVYSQFQGFIIMVGTTWHPTTFQLHEKIKRSQKQTELDHY